jgi:hypothetical protein
MLVPVKKDIFRCVSNDPQLGIEQVGHIVVSEGSVIALDSPMVPGLPEAMKVLGKPEAVIILNLAHSRGGVMLSRRLGVPLYVPDVKGSKERDPAELIRIHSLQSGMKYGEDSVLPLHMKAHYLRGETTAGELVIDEMALEYGNSLFVGDSARFADEKLSIFPTGLFPDPDGSKASANKVALERIVRKTGARDLFSGHGSDLVGRLGEFFP